MFWDGTRESFLTFPIRLLKHSVVKTAVVTNMKKILLEAGHPVRRMQVLQA